MRGEERLLRGEKQMKKKKKRVRKNETNFLAEPRETSTVYLVPLGAC